MKPFVLHTRVITGTGGGPEKTILNSPRFLRDEGFDSACLFMHPPDDEGFQVIRDRAAECRAEIISVPDNGPFDWRVIRKCVRLCRERNVTIWHAHDYKSNAIGLLVQRFHPLRLVTTVHGWVRHTRRTPLYYWVDRASLKRYDRVICVSDDLHARCAEMGLPPDRLSLVKNAIVVNDYARERSREEARAEWDVPPDRFLLGACGRLSEEKGFDLLIKAVRELTEESLNVGLVIAGEGHLEPDLSEAIRAADLNDRVRLAGFVADPRTLYQAVDLFVLSSLREGLPNVVLEAMATGVPVLSTRVAGIPAVLVHRENGYIVEPGNGEALREGLRDCIGDHQMRSRMAVAGHETVATRFSFAQRMRTVADIYRGLIDSPAPAETSQSTDATVEIQA